MLPPGGAAHRCTGGEAAGLLWTDGFRAEGEMLRQVADCAISGEMASTDQ